MSNYSPSATLPEQLRANLAIVELFRNQARQCLETAERIDRNRLSYSGGPAGWPRIGVGIAGGSSSGVSTGFGIGFPLFPQTTEAAGSINESRFSFAIPDIAAYNTNWQRWKIHVDLSDGVNSRSFESLPPPPPPG